jgi:hypothetical protein
LVGNTIELCSSRVPQAERGQEWLRSLGENQAGPEKGEEEEEQGLQPSSTNSRTREKPGSHPDTHPGSPRRKKEVVTVTVVKKDEMNELPTLRCESLSHLLGPHH